MASRNGVRGSKKGRRLLGPTLASRLKNSLPGRTRHQTFLNHSVTGSYLSSLENIKTGRVSKPMDELDLNLQHTTNVREGAAAITEIVDQQVNQGRNAQLSNIEQVNQKADKKLMLPNISANTDDELDGEGFGLEARHFFESSGNAENESFDFGAPLNEDGRLRIRPDIVLDGREYAGIKSTRRAVFEENKDTSGNEDEMGKSASHLEKIGTFLCFDETSEEEEHDCGLQSGSFNDEMVALNKEYKELQKQEEEMLITLKAQGDEDIKKAQAVSSQKMLWDRALEMRISLQKHFFNANRLPQEDVWLNYCRTDTETANAFAQLATSAVQTLDIFADLLKALVDQNSTISWPGETIPAPVKGILKQPGEDGEEIQVECPTNLADAAWEQLNSLYSRIVPFRNSSVDRWQRKTQLSTGAVAAKHKLYAFNQSISQQIATFMEDPSRLTQRMLHKRSSMHVFGMPAGKIKSEQNDATHDATTAMHVNDEVWDDVNPELVDDSEFYEGLLHEFLESSDPTYGNMSLYSVRKLRNKRRKVVDRRASKGRKIRYSVHDKIVNFMAPEPMNLPAMAEILFADLFGQKSQG
eukprot:c27489_g1_i1 orf=438-2186(-)